MSLEVRHRRPAERRQVHPLQRAHQGRHRGGELSVLHHRAERRHRRGARPAAGRARRDREAAEGDRRRSSSSSTSPAWSRAPPRARASATSSSPTSARPTRSRTSCAASRTTNVIHVDGKVDPIVGHRDHQHRAGARRPRDGREGSSPSYAQGRAAPAATRRRSGWSRCSSKVQPVLDEAQPARCARPRRRRSVRCSQPLFLLTVKPMMYVANVAEHGFEDNPLLERVRGACGEGRRAGRRRSARRIEARDRRPRRRGQGRCSSPTWAWPSRA